MFSHFYFSLLYLSYFFIIYLILHLFLSSSSYSIFLLLLLPAYHFFTFLLPLPFIYLFDPTFFTLPVITFLYYTLILLLSSFSLTSLPYPSLLYFPVSPSTDRYLYSSFLLISSLIHLVLYDITTSCSSISLSTSLTLHSPYSLPHLSCFPLLSHMLTFILLLSISFLFLSRSLCTSLPLIFFSSFCLTSCSIFHFFSFLPTLLSDTHVCTVTYHRLTIVSFFVC